MRDTVNGTTSIADLIDEVLDSPQIRAALDAPPDYLQASFVREQLLGRVEAIRDEAAPAFEAAEHADEIVMVEHVRHADDVSGPDGMGGCATYVFGSVLVLAAAVAVFVGFLATVVAHLTHAQSFSATGTWLWTTLIGRMAIAAIALLFIGGFSYMYVGSRQIDRSREQVEDWVVKNAEWLLRDAIEKSKAAHDHVRDALADAVLQQATIVMNAHTRSFYQDRLYVIAAGSPDPKFRVTSGHGLVESSSREHMIGTEQRKRVASMIEKLPGASIGVAGPRGAGKSTLLWWI